MSYAEDSHAKTSQLQGKAKASRKLQGLVSGSNSSKPYAWYDQSTSSWRTYQRSLITDWELFSGTFTRQGYMSASGAVFQAALLGLATNEIDGGLLPTPLASNLDRKAKFKQGGTPLRAVIDREMLPTPRAAKGMNMKLSEGMAKLEYKKYLETEIAAKIHTDGEVQNTDSIQTGDNMYLNPAFVEEMMGYPIGHTDLRH